MKIYNANFSLKISLNDDGEVNFPPVERGNFNLQIVIENETIEINDASVS